MNNKFEASKIKNCGQGDIISTRECDKILDLIR